MTGGFIDVEARVGMGVSVKHGFFLQTGSVMIRGKQVVLTKKIPRNFPLAQDGIDAAKTMQTRTILLSADSLLEVIYMRCLSGAATCCLLDRFRRMRVEKGNRGEEKRVSCRRRLRVSVGWRCKLCAVR